MGIAHLFANDQGRYGNQEPSGSAYSSSAPTRGDD